MHPIAFLQLFHPGLLAQFGIPRFPVYGVMTLWTLIFVFIVVVFIAILGLFVFRMVRGMSEWSENNQEPVLTVPARVVTKRTAVSVYSTGQAGNNAFSTGSSTQYFATFEFPSGDRKEFGLTASQYGLLAENDTGQLSLQGMRYKGFKRTAATPAAGGTPVAEDREPPATAERFCPHCGAPVSADFGFCPRCGKPQPITTPPS